MNTNKKYKSINGFIRDTLIEQILNKEGEFTQDELHLINEGINEAKHSKGIPWENIRKDV